MKKEKYNTVAIVSHDAGGAELVTSYSKNFKCKVIFSLEGPAINVFQRKFGVYEHVPIKKAIESADWILCGTSWASELEIEAIKIAKKLNKKTIAFLDHWGNYLERFIRQGDIYIPDEIWVADVYAQELANKIFKDVKISLIENPYFKDLENEIKSKKIKKRDAKSGLTILFVSEPLSTHGKRRFGNEKHWGYTESEGLNYFFENLWVLEEEIKRIIIRPHPSEEEKKYTWALTVNQYQVEISSKENLIDDILESDIVVGFQSMAIIVALLAKKRAISAIPPGGKKLSLPYSQIELLQELTKINYEEKDNK